MATQGTINSERTHSLLEKNIKENENFYLLPCEGLANAIETKNDSKIDELLKKYLTEYQNKQIAQIIENNS